MSKPREPAALTLQVYMKYNKLAEKYNNGSFILKVFEEASSTNDEIKAFLSEDKVSICIACRQNSGRGRLGRSFSSEAGGLYISFAKKFDGVAEEVFSIMPLSSLCVVNAVEPETGGGLSIKWPNDVLLGSRKLCGILAEGCLHQGEFYLILGIGINVNNSLPEGLDTAVSIKAYTGRTSDTEEIAERLIEEVVGLLCMDREERAGKFEIYREKCGTIGKTVRFMQNGETITGKVTWVNDNGALVLRSENGKERLIISGEATILK